MAKVAFIGLGVMGYPMAGHLKAKGEHDVIVYNRTSSKAQAWQEEYGGKTAPTPEIAARDCDFVFCCVGNDNDLRDVTLGENGAFDGLKEGAVFIDHTTASAQIAKELDAQARLRNCNFIDAPVSGGQAGAENGVLTIMCGGNAPIFDKAKLIMDVYARMVSLMGPAGSGQLTKMVNQICIAGLVQGLAEGVHFAKQAGLDAQKAFEVISKGAAGSWQLENRSQTMIKGEYDFGFAVDWMRKDLDIVLAQASQMGARLPVTALVDQFYGDIQAAGGNRWDTSSLLTRLEK